MKEKKNKDETNTPSRRLHLPNQFSIDSLEAFCEWNFGQKIAKVPYPRTSLEMDGILKFSKTFYLLNKTQ